jgi:hypothetical protein
MCQPCHVREFLAERGIDRHGVLAADDLAG